VRSEELGQSIRAWRDRLDPAEAGLSAGARRRAPGLRREELASLRMIVYSRSPDSEDAEKLALVGVVGLQRMAG
jgi:hypothetical protein